MADSIECVVIGAGVIGLAIAREMAAAGLETIVLEKENRIGTANASMNPRANTTHPSHPMMGGNSAGAASPKREEVGVPVSTAPIRTPRKRRIRRTGPPASGRIASRPQVAGRPSPPASKASTALDDRARLRLR